MTAWHIVLILVLVLLTVLCSWKSDQRIQEELTTLFSGRPDRGEDDYYDKFFGGSDVPRDVVSGIRAIFSEHVGVDLSALEADDDFSKEYSIIWDLDSLADVEIIIAIEEKFDVEISGGEASEITTIRGIAESVANKLRRTEMG